MTNDKDKMTRHEINESLATKSDTNSVSLSIQQLKSLIENRPT